MAFEFENFDDPNLDADYVTYLIDQQSADVASAYRRFWDYFRNPFVSMAGLSANVLNGNSRPYFQAQEAGLPARITGVERCPSGDQQLTNLRRKEVVIENEIAWRIHTMIDFLFGKCPSIRSQARNVDLAQAIEAVVTAMLEANGSLGLFQEIALYGCVYGFVDIALRTPADKFAGSPSALERPDGSLARQDAAGSFSAVASAASRPGTSENNSSAQRGRQNLQDDTDRAVAIARGFQWETIEAYRVLPILEEDDYRRVRYWIQRFYKHPPHLVETKRPWFLRGWGKDQHAGPALVEVVEIIGLNWWQRYEDRRLVAEAHNLLGRVPVVHIQNVALPGSYEGLSDVEPLIALQDELNTRLSDRANRVTYQSFKMYLGKGIDDFLERPVGPGQMWSTQNLDASIEEFGSDTGSPSEDAHIEQTLQAMDKVSGVTPLAAGLIRGNVGNRRPRTKYSCFDLCGDRRTRRLITSAFEPADRTYSNNSTGRFCHFRLLILRICRMRHRNRF
ncbi:MAG: phage portal protein [Planctomycetota bacterium]|nr:phage portal protein [Planctomycetota bacterium]